MTTEYDFSGRTLNQRYILKRRIGAGSFATVYLAEDLRMYKRKVAVKVLNPERRLNPSNVERFIQEVKVASKLDGPYRDRVVRIIDQGRCDVAQPPLLYLVMEHVEGVTLQSLLRPRGPDQPRQPLPWTQAASIIRELLKALGTLHGCGVVHRDIKPGNCILEQRPDGDFLKLLDLGIVKVMPGFEMTGDHPRTHPEFVLGTPRYMAPEQFGGPCSEPSIDLYAAGIMLYEFLTGDVPARWYEQKGSTHPYEPLPPSQINMIGAIPPALDAITLRAIAFEPAKRFPSAVAFAEALSKLLLTTSSIREEPVTEPRATPVATAGHTRAVVQEEAPDPVGSLLRWWTIASTTCTAMVFVFAFASVLRRAESRPALELESDEAPAVAVEAPTRRAPVVAARTAAPSPAPSTFELAALAVPGSPAASPPAAVTPASAPPAEAPIEAPVAEPPGDAPVAPRPKKPRPAKTKVDDPGPLMPVAITVAGLQARAEQELQKKCGDPQARRPITIVAAVNIQTGTLTRIDLIPDTDDALHDCVMGRAKAVFQFAKLAVREAKYTFHFKL